MQKYLLFTCLLMTQWVGYAQQEQQYSQFVINPFTINPAIAGTEDFIDVQIGHRSQWTGFSGAPTTSYLTVHGTIGKTPHQYHFKKEHKNWHGLGAQFYEDKTGPIKRNTFQLAYAYNIGLTKKTRLSTGAFIGMKSTRLNQSYWENIENSNDQLFKNDLSSGLQPDLQLGAVLYNPTYFLTFSASNLFGNTLSLEGTSQTQNWQHLYLSGGYKFHLSYNTTITPLIMTRYAVNTPLSVNIATKIEYNKLLWYGASFRFTESMNAFAGVNLKKHIDLSYAYEWSFSKIKNYNNGTHEIILGLRINQAKNIVCPSKYW